MIPGSATPLFLSNQDTGYQIERSLRFNSADSAYLNRTPSSAGNRKTWTWSGWVKRSGLGSQHFLFQGGNTDFNDDAIAFIDDKLNLSIHNGSNALVGQLRTTQLFRDPSAWYHIVVVFDTTNATADDRIRFYVNGEQITDFSSRTNPPENTESHDINDASVHYIGTYRASQHFLGGYLADVHFIDGQALAPTDFGQYDDNNVWQPKGYTGTYNPQVNNSQDWSSSPYNSGNTADASYPATNAFNGSVGTTYTDGWLPTQGDTITWTANSSFSSATSVRIYYIATGGGALTVNGSAVTTNNDSTVRSVIVDVTGTGFTGFTNNWVSSPNGPMAVLAVEVDGVRLVDTTVSSLTSNSFHLDFSDNSSNAALGTDSSGNSNDWTVNNLQSGGGLQADQAFDVVTYTGNGSTQSITGLSFQPDFVWIKARSAAQTHVLTDSVRGTSSQLFSNLNNAEGSQTDQVTAFNSDGFSLGANSGGTGGVNINGTTYVAWCWKAGGTASSNTDGTITSSVSADPAYGFSIVSYTGTGAAATVGHGLNAKPVVNIIKRTGATTDWVVYTDIIDGSWDYLLLNSTAGQAATSVFSSNSSTFDFSGSATVGNISGSSAIAYCFAPVDGFSKFGTTVVPSSGTQTVTVGFKPKFLIIKRVDASQYSSWALIDSERGTTYDQILWANKDYAAGLRGNGVSAGTYLDVTFSDAGFAYSSGQAEFGQPGTTNIYMAFAERPPAGIIDSLIDTPTDYQESPNNRGNYATLNPLAISPNVTPTLSNGNLEIERTATSAEWTTCGSTFAVNSGKWYWELTCPTIGSRAADNRWGVADADDYEFNRNTAGTGLPWLGSGTGTSWSMDVGGVTYHNGGAVNSSYTSALTTSDVIGVALDCDSGTLTYYKNGTSLGVAFSNLGSRRLTPAVGFHTNSHNKVIINFGQRPFAYTAPTGYKALCTTNLPNATIADGSTAFDAKLYTGNGTTNIISGLNFAPDLVWIKARNQAHGHNIYDIVKGATLRLNSANTNADQTVSTGLTSFNSDGFTLGADSGPGHNINGDSLVAWTWDGGTSNTSISAGGLNSSVYSYDNWTSMVTGNYSSAHGWGTTYQTLNAFDGNLSTMVIAHGTDGWKFEPTNPISGDTIEIYGWNDGCPDAYLKINGNNYGDALGADQTVGQWYTLPYSTLSSIEMPGDGSPGNNEFRLIAIRIDGRILIQNNQSPPNVPLIASTVRANPSAGFSIVEIPNYTYPTKTAAHGLNAEPEFIISKNTGASNPWMIYHKSAGVNTYFQFDAAAGYTGVSGVWSGVSSSVFPLHSSVNQQTDIVAYCFAPVEGYSAFGSYTGNGSTDGTFVFTGFRPAFLLIKRTDASSSWYIFDSARSTVNVVDDRLQAHSNNAESTNAAWNNDFLSNGFKLRTSEIELNNNGSSYIYACFSEHPFKTARAR